MISASLWNAAYFLRDVEGHVRFASSLAFWFCFGRGGRAYDAWTSCLQALKHLEESGIYADPALANDVHRWCKSRAGDDPSRRLEELRALVDEALAGLGEHEAEARPERFAPGGETLAGGLRRVRRNSVSARVLSAA